MKNIYTLESAKRTVLSSTARLVIVLLLCLSVGKGWGQVTITSGSPSYSQNFNTLAAINGTAISWTNNTTITGWYLFNSANSAITSYSAETGATGNSTFNSYGTPSGNTERALGSQGSGGTYWGSPAGGAVAGYMALALTNSSGTTINSVTISFDGEQWRRENNAAAQTMTLQYGFGATFATVSSWTNAGSGFNFTSPIVGATTVTGLDGNAAANRSAGLGGTLSSLGWTNGVNLWIRWVETNDAGNDHGLAIDNFSFTATIPATTPTVNLSVTSNSGSEASPAAITVTATASAAVTGNQTVSLGVSGTNITAGDYSLSGTTITILSGQTTGTATFTVSDDAAVEGPETATLTISNPSAGITLGSNVTQNIAITDNDVATTPLVTLSVSSNSGSEASANIITVTATADAAVSGAQTVNVGVSGTGITAGDFSLSNTVITIPDGGTTGSVTFTIIDDAAIEGTETATLTISNPSSGLTLGSTVAQNVAITDNDFNTVNLSVSTNAGTEATPAAITVTATAAQAVSGAQTVSLAVTGTGITAADYTLSSTTITIPNGQTTSSVTFTVVDDASVEGTETATLTISSPSSGITLGSTTTQNITITDNDFAPANDNCSGAINLTADAAAISGTFLNSTPMTGATKNDVFYMFTPGVTGSHTITINTFSASGDKDMYVYSTCPATYTTSGTTASGTGTSTTSETATGTFTAGTSYKILLQDFAGSGGTFDISITGPPATLSTNGTSNFTFANQNVLTTSSGQTFNLSGSALTGAPGNITVNAPNTNFQVSNDNTAWGATTTIAYTSSTLASTALYVRFTPQSSGAKSGNVTFSGGGVASPPTIALTGNGVLPPPVATAATNIGSTHFDANWAAVSGATSYRLDVSTSPTFGTSASGTVVGWDFQGSSTTATSGIAANNAKTITTGGGTSAITFTTVSGSTTGRADTWNSGSGTKYWEAAAFSTVGFTDLKVSSKQRSSGTGPKDFKLQYKVGAGAYADVTGGSITVADNLTTGVLNSVSLPAECDNKSSVSLRWIMTSNTSVGNGTTASAGASNIDDIIIAGTTSTPSFVSGYSDLNVGNVTTYPVTGLAPNTTYYYRVRAVSDNSTSANSIAITITTLKDQATSDYVSNGNVTTSSATNWLYNSTGSTFIAASVPPSSTNNVSILNGHTVTVTNHFVVGSGKSFTMNATSSMVVNATSSFTITGAANFNGQHVTFKSDATGTASMGTLTGTLTNASNVTVERHISGTAGRRAWRWLTAPVAVNSNTIFNAWQDAGDNNSGIGTHITGPGGQNGLDAGNTYSMKYFDGSVTLQNITATDVPISAASTSAANKSYFIFVRGDRAPQNLTVGNANPTTLSATGTLQTGTQTFNSSATASPFMIVGNPYASPVDFDKITRSTNITRRFWAWDPYRNTTGGYVLVEGYDPGSFIIPGNTDQTQHLQSGQAVFVKKDNATETGSVTFEEDDKSTTGTPGVFRGNGGVIESLATNLYLEDGATLTLADAVISRYNTDFNTAVTNEDATKFNNLNENLAIARDGTNLTIERRPLIDADDTIFLKLWNTTKRNYQFKFIPTNFSAAGLTAFLQDDYLKTSTSVSLDGETIVSFNVNNDAASANINRFRIVFKASSVLPISFTNVKAFEKSNNIQVEWNLGNETNMSGYEVEKSIDGRTFTKAGVQAARVIASSTENYTWLDGTPNAGNNFYRIKAIERSGAYKYSQVVNVKLGKGAGAISIYPNPVKGNTMNVQFVNQPKGKYALQLFNNLGQEVYRSELNHAGGSSTQNIQLNSKMAKGIYQLQVTTGDSKTTQKVILD